MANLFDLYTFTPPAEGPKMMTSLAPTGLDSIDTDLSVDLKLTPAQNLSSKEMFEQALANVGKGKANAPLFTYGDKEARRYDIPSMQYTPGKTIIGTDIEDMYSKNQEWYKKLGNGVLKGVAFAGGTFASSFLTIPSTVDLVRQGNYSKAFNDDSLFPWIQESLTNLEDTLPNYYTEWEREHPYLSGVPFVTGSANFWGDKVIKNIGFSVGAIGAGIVQSAAIEVATAGAGTPLAALKIGQALKNAIPGMFRGFRNLTKVAQSANAVQDMASMTRMGNNIAKSIETAALASNLTKSAKFLTTTYLSAQGEAFIEGYHTYLDVKNNFYKQLLNNELTPAQAGEIEQTAQDAGRLTTNINLALLMFSNAVQFPRLLGATPKNEFVEAFTKVITKDGGIQYAKNYSKKKATLLTGWEWVKDSFMEGGEEFGQAVTGNSVIDYYMDKFSPAREGALYYIRKQLENDELYQEAFLGAISGFLMGGYAPFSRNFVNVDNRLSKAVDQMNSTLRKFDNATRLISSSISTDEAGIVKEHEEFKAKFNMVNMAKTTGTYDMLLDHLKDSANLPIEEFNKLFHTDLKNDTDKALKINELMRELDDYAYIIDKVNQTYSENPYQTDNVLIKKLKNAFGDLDTLNLERTQAYLYEEWKSTMAYTIARSQNVGSQKSTIKEAMSSYGYSPESHEFLKGIARGSRTTVKEYTTYKNAQINALLQEDAYLRQQLEIADSSSPAGARPKDYQRKIEEVNKRREEIQEVVKKVEALSKGLSVAVTEEQALVDKDKREELLKILIEEEFSILNYLVADKPKPKPDETVKEDVKEKTKKAVQLDKEEEGLNETLENLNKTAEQLVDVEQANTEEIPGPKVTVPIEIDENSWKNNISAGDEIVIKIGKDDVTFTVTSSDPDLDHLTLLSKQGIIFYLRKLKPTGYLLSTDSKDQSGNDKPSINTKLSANGFVPGEIDKLEKRVENIVVYKDIEQSEKPATTDIETKNTISNGDKIISVENKPITNEIKNTKEEIFLTDNKNPEERIFINVEPLRDVLVVPNNTLTIIDKKNNKEIVNKDLNAEGAVIFESMQGRLFIVANINGQLIPFYKSSSGTSGKTQGSWYPFFGYTGAWLVKGSVEKSTGKMSYSPEIDRVTDLLNENLVFPDKYLNRSTNTITDTNKKVIVDMNKFFKINRLWQKEFGSQTGNGTNYQIKGLKENTRNEAGLVALITGLNTTELDSSKTPKEVAEWLDLIITNTKNTNISSDIESKKADIEKRRQEELENTDLYQYDKKFKEFQTYGSTVKEAFDNLFEQVKNNPTDKKLSDLLDYINERLVPEDIRQDSDKNPLVQEYIDDNQQNIDKANKSTKSRQAKINAKYDAELAALEGTKSTPKAPVSDVEAKKADIERRIQEVENFVNQEFFADSELLSNYWKTKKDLFSNKVKQLKDLLQKGIKTGEDLRTLTNLLNDIRGILNEGININNKTAILTNEKNIQELANSLLSLISDNVIKEYIEVMNKAMESRVGSNAVEKMLVGYSDGSGYTIDGKNVEYFLSKETLDNAKNNKQINAKYDAELNALESTQTQPTSQEEVNQPIEEQPSVLSTYYLSKNTFTVTQAQHENKIFVPFNFSINALKRDSIQGYIYTRGQWYAIRINKDGQTTTPILRNPPGNLKQLVRKVGDNSEEELKPVTVEEMEAPTDDQPTITNTDRFLGTSGTLEQKDLLNRLQNLNLIKIDCL